MLYPSRALVTQVVHDVNSLERQF